MQQSKVPNKEKSLSLFQINSCLSNNNFEEIQNLLQSRNISLDVIVNSETRIPKNVSVTQNIELNNYSFEQTITEYLAGGTVLYIAS